MSTQPNVKQLKPGTNNQILLTTGGVATWGNPLATTSALGEVALATQSQAFNGSPDTSGGYPLVVQPSGMLIRKNQTVGTGEIYLMSSNAAPPALASPNARGVLALDLQSEIQVATEVASGNRAIAIGTRNTVSALFSLGIGRLNVMSGGGYAGTIGYQNTNNTSVGTQNYIYGYQNSITSPNANVNQSTLVGSSNSTIINQSNIFGFANTINSTAGGGGNITVVGNSNTTGTLANNTVVFGNQNTGSGNSSVFVGLNNNGFDGTQAFIFGQSNQIFGGGADNTVIGQSNSIQGTPSQNIAAGSGNTLLGGNLNACFGIGNNIGSTGGDNSAIGNGNVFAAGSYGGQAIGRSNSILASASSANAFGSQNTAGQVTECFGRSNAGQTFSSYNSLFGFANLAVGNYGLGATDCAVFGRGNTAGRNSVTVSIFGRSNSVNGTSSVVVGNGNTAFVNGQTRNNIFGSNNTVFFSTTKATVLAGYGNNAGNISTDGSYSNFFGRNNSAQAHCNFFGESNSFSANGNTADHNNVFGRANNSGAGGSTISVTNSECFGTFNEIGSINSFGPASVDQGITFGRYNTIVSNQAIAIGANNSISIGSTTSTFVGWNNIADPNAVNSGAFGTGNTLANYNGTGSQSSFAIGNANRIGFQNSSVNAKPASNALAVGSLNQATSDNCQVFGYANFTGSNINTIRSAIAIGILNNSNASYATINNTTGVITGTPQQFSASPIGINSIAIGSENLTTGLNSIAIGRHCSATGTESIAFGIRCVASGTAATAFGNRAVARIDNTLNIGGLPIIRKDNGEALGTEFTSFSGMPAIIQSKTIDLTVATLYLIQLPIGPRFWIDEVGIEVVTNTVTSVTATPFVSWGTKVNASYTQKYRQIDQMFGLTVAGSRETFSTFENDSGETSDISNTVSLGARIEIGATTTGPGTYTGRFYWIGRYVEQ